MFGRLGLPEILIIGVVLIVLFGRGKVSALMGEMGQGIKAFKKGLTEAEREETPPAEPEKPLEIAAPSAPRTPE